MYDTRDSSSSYTINENNGGNVLMLEIRDIFEFVYKLNFVYIEETMQQLESVTHVHTTYVEQWDSKLKGMSVLDTFIVYQEKLMMAWYIFNVENVKYHFYLWI